MASLGNQAGKSLGVASRKAKVGLYEIGRDQVQQVVSTMNKNFPRRFVAVWNDNAWHVKDTKTGIIYPTIKRAQEAYQTILKQEAASKPKKVGSAASSAIKNALKHSDFVDAMVDYYGDVEMSSLV